MIAFKCNLNSMSKNKGDEDQNEPIQINNEVKFKANKFKAKPQACKLCGKMLSSASSYYVHMKLHSNEKPFRCHMCDAAFCRKPYLDVHLRTHTGERPFECEQCHKRFTQKSSLNTHKRVHSGERPFACKICHKRFALKSYVTAHQWSHVTDKQLSCSLCSETFHSKSLYIVHMRGHANPTRHHCPVCGRSFIRSSYLMRHQSRVHNGQVTSLEITPTIRVGHGRVQLDGDLAPKRNAFDEVEIVAFQDQPDSVTVEMDPLDVSSQWDVTTDDDED